MTNLYGSTHGLKAHHLKRLEQICRRNVKDDQVVTPAVARLLTTLSCEIGRQIGILVGRDGTIYTVLVGNEHEILIPDLADLRFGKRALRGVRLIHTHLKNEPLSEDDLTDLALLRLDVICAVGVLPDGLPGTVYMAHLRPPNWQETDYDIDPPLSLPLFPF